MVVVVVSDVDVVDAFVDVVVLSRVLHGQIHGIHDTSKVLEHASCCSLRCRTTHPSNQISPAKRITSQHWLTNGPSPMHTHPQHNKLTRSLSLTHHAYKHIHIHTLVYICKKNTAFAFFWSPFKKQKDAGIKKKKMPLPVCK